MGFLYQRGNVWWLRVTVGGKPKSSSTGCSDKKKAEAVLEHVLARIEAGESIGDEDGAITVAAYAERVIEKRKARDLSGWKIDRSRMRANVLPVIGKMLLTDVRPRHVLAVVERAQSRSCAPRSVRNIYYLVSALFNEAVGDQLIETSPCTLNRNQIGTVRDKDPAWRESARYTRDEVIALMSDRRVPEDRRVLYALKTIGMLRHGEAAGLTFARLNKEAMPLAKLSVVLSYRRPIGDRKGPRAVPVHPELRELLDRWWARGWQEVMGRPPTLDDLVVPAPPSVRYPEGHMRTKDIAHKDITADLALLGFRHRRGHDLRRTGITVYLEDGASKDLLRVCSHGQRIRDGAIDLYISYEWFALCGEISKLKLRLPGSKRTSSRDAGLPSTTSTSTAPGTAIVVTAPVTVPTLPQESRGDKGWADWDSNPAPTD